MSEKSVRGDRDVLRRWRKFVLENAELLQEVGFPLYLQEKKERFDHWLMHGCHPDDYTGFSLAGIDPAGRRCLSELVKMYFHAGFKDPGIVVLTEDELSALTGTLLRGDRPAWGGGRK
ncbi:MAG: hypothetical protein KC593_20890 [Myxococcales bacterium]|nr:hypothetical protein [Myxococcales bacterium]MCB9626606.1 hypothetical protein [Sandaracinaceae bacterium]